MNVVPRLRLLRLKLRLLETLREILLLWRGRGRGMTIGLLYGHRLRRTSLRDVRLRITCSGLIRVISRLWRRRRGLHDRRRWLVIMLLLLLSLLLLPMGALLAAIAIIRVERALFGGRAGGLGLRRCPLRGVRADCRGLYVLGLLMLSSCGCSPIGSVVWLGRLWRRRTWG
jgi:hypothetical protein